MGSSKRQTVGYHYRWAKHYGWCLPVDAVLAMKFGGVLGWIGRLTGNARVSINRPDLWGGESEQGGVVGEIDVEFGGDDQEINSYLAEVFGPKQSGNRGILSTVFRGGRYGAYVPNPKPMALKVERIFADWKDGEVWYPERARVTLVAPQSAAFYFALDDSGSMLEMTPNGKTRLANMQDAVGQVLTFIQANLIEAGAVVDICIVRYSGSASTMTRRGVSVGDMPALKAFAAGGSGSGNYTNFAAGCAPMTGFYGSVPGDMRRLAFFITDGEPNNPAGDPPGTVAQAARAIIDAISPRVSVHGINIDLSDTTYTDMVDNTGGAEVVAGGEPGALVDAVARVFSGTNGMNPAHIVYDAITYLKGHPVAMINDENFRAAADRFYSEGFGLCTRYDASQETPDQFIERICRVAGANCQPSRVDGLWRLDPVRDDYDPQSLPVITEVDIDMARLRYEPAVPVEMANSVRVEWYDPSSDEDRITPSDPALGHVRAVGGVIEQTRQYREIPAEALALRIARRDRTVMSVPVDRYTLPLKRNRRDLLLGNPVRLQLPSIGVAETVVRVGKAESGTHIEGGLTVTAAQVAAHLPSTVHIQPSPSEWVPPDYTPVPSPHQVAFELPYVALAAALPPGELQALTEDAGFAAVAASRPPTGTNFVLATAAGSNVLAEAGTFDWCPSAVVVEAADHMGTGFTLAGGSLLDRVAAGSWALWEGADGEFEIVRVDQLEDGLVLGRGCADTPPIEHPAGSRIWFCGEWLAADEQQYVGGETIQLRTLTRTSHGQLRAQDATALEVALEDRQARPYPPANVTINGMWPVVGVQAGNIVVEWNHRDRVLQADQLLEWGASSVGPELGTEYFVRAFDAISDMLLLEGDPVDGTTYSFDLEWTGQMRVEVVSLRDGLECWRAPTVEFAYENSEFQVFAGSGTFTVPAGVTAVDVVVVGGGGGGGSRQGGGGGGGGVVVSTVSVTPEDTIAVVVGDGGAGGTSGGRGSNGQSSQFGVIAALGGGGGGGRTSNNAGSPGGSGGGGGATSSISTSSGGSGAAGEGNAGGSGKTDQISLVVYPAGGGGGGAGSAGESVDMAGGVSNGGDGGVGVQFAQFSAYGDGGWFAGGGGGGAGSGLTEGGGPVAQYGGSGGKGGGGAGKSVDEDGFVAHGDPGLPNTGGGGGASSDGASTGGPGGSGIVIVSWPAGRLPPTVSARRAITVTV